MTQKKRRKIAMIVAVVLAALIILSAITGGILTLIVPKAEGAVTQSDLDKTREEINRLITERQRLKVEKEELQQEFNKIDSENTNIIALKVSYDSQIENAENEIDITKKLLSKYTLALAEYQWELEEAVKKETELRRQYAKRVRAMEGMGDISYLGILLQAESLSDLLTRWDAVNKIMAQDQRLIDDLLAASKDVIEKKARIEQDKIDVEATREEQEFQQAELARLSRESDKMMNEYTLKLVQVKNNMQKTDADIQTVEDAKREAEKEEKDQEEALKEIEAEKKRANNPYVGGEYKWPVPGYYNISSPFGDRMHPVYKVRKHHNGIDIAPAPRGAEIVASNRGTIIIRKKSSSYGNYVVIDHGGGQSTLYAHLSKFADGQQVGSKVEAEELIGYVGSTGVSTGNHLHFEIHKDGAPVNPMTPGLLKK